MEVNNYKKDEAKTKFSWKNMKRMMTYVHPYRKDFIKAILIGMLASILFLALPKIFSYTIDTIFPKKEFLPIILVTILATSLIILSVILTKRRRNIINILLNKIAYDIKLDLFKKLQVLPGSYYDTRSHGKIYTRATTYPDEVAVIFCYVILEIIVDLINLIFVVIFMLTSDIRLSCISILFASLLTILFVFLAPIRRRWQHVVNDKNSNVNAYVSESISGIRITQSFNREEQNEDILKTLEKERIDSVKRTLFIGNLNWSLTGILNYVSMALVYFIGLKYFYPALSIGVIMAIDSYSSHFWGPIEYLMSCYNDLMDASTYLERIFELLDEPVVIENAVHPKKIKIKGNVEFRDVTFRYDTSRDILKHTSFQIAAGEKVGLVGETGSGKSTILNLISRFYDIQDGEILIDGVPIKDIDLGVLRRDVNMMLQDNFLFARSVYDNLVLDKKIKKDEVIKICKMLDIHDMILNLEKGYDTILLNNGSNLSSGERQLLCIARIMIQNPKILILDEATSNIDLMTEKKIEKAFNLVTKNRTTIMVAHRISTIKNCDKIILIKNHKNYEEGTHQELMKKKGEYYKLYKRQAVL